MKTITILNPAAGGGRAERLWKACRARAGSDFAAGPLWRTSGPGEASRYARKALQSGMDRIIVVGGDGTFNEVLNGSFLNGSLINPDALLVPVPAGTGSDLVRSLRGVASDRGESVSIDIGHLRCVGEKGKKIVRYFANVASCGQSAEVVKVVRRLRLPPWCGGKVIYLLAVLSTLWRYRPEYVALTVDGELQISEKFRCIAVANTKTFAGGLIIAPDAELTDGAFHVTTLSDTRPARLLVHALSIYSGRHSGIPGIRHFSGRHIVVKGPGTVQVEADGERCGWLPASFTVIPAAVRIGLIDGDR